MLLVQLTLFILGVFLPNEIRLVYFTHILIFCLYLLATKNYKHLIFITILTVLLLVTWSKGEGELNVTLDKIYTFPISSLKMDGDFGLRLNQGELEGSRVRVGSFSWFAENDIAVELLFDDRNKQSDKTSNPLTNLLKVKIISVVKQDLNDSWIQRHLYRSGLSAQVRLEVLDWSPNQRSDLAKVRLNLRQNILNELDVLYSALEGWGLMKALLFGDVGSLSQKYRWIIKYLGLMHLFVVSGLHVGFVYFMASLIAKGGWRILPQFFISFFKHKDVFSLSLLIPVVCFYAYLAGWGESVQRAVLMLVVWKLVNLLGIKAPSFNVLFISLCLILIIDPLALLSPGLWLSFSLVLLLLLYFDRRDRGMLQALRLQVILSLCATSLVLGWQSSVSAGIILINLVVLPIAGMVFFPLVFVGCLVGYVSGDTSLMIWLDAALMHVMKGFELVSIELPVITLRTNVSLPLKVFLFLVSLIWVVYRHKVSVWLMSPILMSVFMFDSFTVSLPASEGKSVSYFLANNSNTLKLYEPAGPPLLSGHWVNNTSELPLMWLGAYLYKHELANTERARILIWPLINNKLSPYILKALSPRWLILKTQPDQRLISLLEAMQVSWFVVVEGERIILEFWRKQWMIKHSNCLIFLISGQESNCMRVAELESVLNYSPKH